MHTLPRRSLLSKFHIRFHGTQNKCNLIYAHTHLVRQLLRNSPVLQQNITQIPSTKFHQNWLTNVESTNKTVMTPLIKYINQCTDFLETHMDISGTNFFQISDEKYTKYRQCVIYALTYSMTFTVPIFTKLKKCCTG
jgi:hypothetical protein